jgi:phosphate-selective porin OprO and OprP
MAPWHHGAKGWIRVSCVSVIIAAFSASSRARDEGTRSLPAPLQSAQQPARDQRPPGAASLSVAQLAERLRAMEETNKRLAEKLERTTVEHNEQMRQMMERYDKLSTLLESGNQGNKPLGAPGGALAGPMAAPGPSNDDSPDAIASPVPDYTEDQLYPFSPPPGYANPKAPGSKRLPLYGTFGPGFQFQTEDEEFGLNVHIESQFDARVWGQRDQVPANSGIFLPRQRIFFTGNITKKIEYELAFNRGIGGNVNILNAFVNLHLDDRFELRFGRFFTPFTYDQYAISNYWLPTPERSLYTTNVGLGRQIGVMGWGYLFDKQLDYAAGIFNGSRNSFESLSNGVDFVAFLNGRPFQESESLKFLRFLNVGTSFDIGYQDQAAVPVSFRIGAASPNADNPGLGTTPFLILNPNVIEKGDRLLGSVHAAYFYKSLSLIGEWQYGYGGYAASQRAASTQIPFGGFYATAGYFLTGEEVERRTRVKPLRPFIPLNAKEERGPGAWELVARVSQLTIGDKIFTAGLANPDLWSNSATTTELGLNWYWNDYVKIYTFWLHGGFGDPVQFRPGGLQKSADMFWLRFQLYF